MTAATNISLNTNLDEAEVRKLLELLRGAAGTVKLSFEPVAQEVVDEAEAVAAPFAQRSPLFWSAVVANLLLVEFGHRRIELELPWLDNRTMSLLERSGLPYALARRVGHTEIRQPSKKECDHWLDPCRRPQYRTTRPFDGLLAGVEQIGRSSQPKKKLLPWVVSDPHSRYLLKDFETALPYAWLEDFVPKPKNQAALGARDQLVPLLRGVMKELIENVAVHAFMSACRPDDRLDLISGFECSSAFITLTEGGAASADRVHLVVSDTGVGIPCTIRARAPGLDMGAEEMLHRVLTGDWKDVSEPPRAVAEGNNGLNWCREELIPYARQAKFVVVTQDGDDLALGEIDADGEVRTERVEDLPLRGTIGQLTIMLPRGLRSLTETSVTKGTETPELERIES